MLGNGGGSVGSSRRASTNPCQSKRTHFIQIHNTFKNRPVIVGWIMMNEFGKRHLRPIESYALGPVAIVLPLLEELAAGKRNGRDAKFCISILLVHLLRGRHAAWKTIASVLLVFIKLKSSTLLIVWDVTNKFNVDIVYRGQLITSSCRFLKLLRLRPQRYFRSVGTISCD